MGYCIDGDDQVDIFISYARVDDERNNDWITDFERYLEKMLRSEIQGSLDEAAEPDRVKKLVVCRDEKNFPSSGDLPEIIHQLVSQSQFLFIFIGSGYLRSDWCLQELDYFRNTSGGTLDLSRVYLIVVDEKAIEALEEETIPAALKLDLTRQRLWQELQKVTNRGIRQHGFLENGAPIPVWQSEGRAKNEFHDVARRLVEEVAGKLLKRRSSLRPAPATPKPAPAVPVQGSPAHGGLIVIGPVPPRLAEARNALITALGDQAPRVIDESDFDDDVALRQQLEGASVLIQPYDQDKPLLGRYGRYAPPGGLMAVLRDALRELRGGDTDSADGTVLWWRPPNITGESELARPEDQAFFAHLDTLPADQKSTFDAAALALQIRLNARSNAQASSVCARVWIEWGDDTERGVIDAAKEQVRARFEQHCAAMADGCPVQASLEFSTGDWEILLSGVNRRRPDGVVIVDSEHKDVAALLDQAEAINDIEEVAQRKMFPGIFSLNSGRQYLPTDAWSFVRFSQSANGEGLTYDDHELSDFVSRLFDVLRARLDSNELRRSGAA